MTGANFNSHSNNQPVHQHQGFTLVELLIVAALFASSALVATTAFTDIQSSQRGIQQQQRTTADSRYVLETIARSVRTGLVNYQTYTNGEAAAGVTVLSTIDQSGVVTCYQFANNQVQVSSPATTTCPASGALWTSFTPSDLSIDDMKFFISPLSDTFRPLPRSQSDCKALAVFDSTSGTCRCLNDVLKCFSGQSCGGPVGATFCSNPNVQPQVTIFMKSSSKTQVQLEKSYVSLQTTVVSRIYQR